MESVAFPNNSFSDQHGSATTYMFSNTIPTENLNIKPFFVFTDRKYHHEIPLGIDCLFFDGSFHFITKVFDDHVGITCASSVSCCEINASHDGCYKLIGHFFVTDLVQQRSPDVAHDTTNNHNDQHNN